MATTCNSEVGISPVLLQAITHQLSTPGGSGGNDANKVVFCDTDGNIIIQRNDLTGEFNADGGELQQYVLQETVASTHAARPRGSRPVILKTETRADGKMQQWEVVPADEENATTHAHEMYVSDAGLDSKKLVFQVPRSDVSTGGVFHLGGHSTRSVKHDGGAGDHGATDDGQQIIIFTHEDDASTQSRTTGEIGANAEVVFDSDPSLSEQQTGGLGVGGGKRARYEGVDVLLINDAGEASYIVPTRDSGKTSQWSNYVKQFEDMGPCPICADKVSGYHYGVYCCESCKGFFKRTVQNKKVFACHRADDCEVTVHSRKKCPACRFRKCVDAGMKVQAIREDRSRGGRSIYDGCSPRIGKVKSVSQRTQPPAEKEKPHHREINVRLEVQSRSPEAGPSTIGAGANLPEPSTPSRGVVAAEFATTPQTSLASILNNTRSGNSGSSGDFDRVKPIVPQLVSDIMNLESLLTEDEDDVPNSDDNFYTSLLQLADQRLYKIVRWARSLPDFAVISTDDQILLLQNCWAELLCLDCCWRSLQTPNEIKLSYSRSIDLEMARELGAVEIVNRMMDLTEYLHRIQLDMHEFACLKVLILMSPDMKGLKDIDSVRDYQEKVTDALMLYTSTHYPHRSNKFGELLLRLPELARTSMMGKELLAQKDLPAEVSSFSLLMELLKTNTAAS
ncbi:steroidogenic factor 1-like [Tubulanus polymorphus]|uniref:steroidogenic factor 1-like n=1 Tax=Tubulanus polymorphus TaxID=672921 RepID=UPI003DA43BA0